MDERAGLSLADQVAEGLRDREPHYFMMEQYGPDGEIMEAWEGPPDGARARGATTVLISGTGYAEPRMDWRERGLVPPRGYHRWEGAE